MTRRLALLVAILATLPAGAPALAADPPADPPSLEGAAAAILVDARDGEVLYAKSPDARRSIASTTKLMTALLTLEQADPEELFTAPDYRAATAESKIDLRPGERMRVADLLEALLLESANDAAATLAEGISGSRQAFVAEMNRRAAELGLLNTSYANPIGLDDRRNYSTASDLAKLARHLMSDPRFAEIVDTPSATLESGMSRRVVFNRNDLLAAYPFVDGVKTGYTDEAGYVLVGSARGATGARVISVVLGEPSEAARNAESIALLRYGLGQFRLAPVLRPRRAVTSAEVEYYDRRVDLVPARRASVLVRRGERLGKRITAPDKVRGDLAAGTPVGRVAVLRDGRVVRRVRLVVAEAVPGAGLPRKIVSTLGLGLTLVILLVMVSSVAFVGMRVRTRRGGGGRPTARRPHVAEPDANEPVRDP